MDNGKTYKKRYESQPERCARAAGLRYSLDGIPGVSRRCEGGTFRDLRDETKYGRMAAIVRLLETTFMRIGNEEYARDNQSFGLTTLRCRQVRVRGARLKFEFRGKSGVEHCVELTDPGLAAIVRRMQDLPGEELFQYVDESGETRAIPPPRTRAEAKRTSARARVGANGASLIPVLRSSVAAHRREDSRKSHSRGTALAAHRDAVSSQFQFQFIRSKVMKMKVLGTAVAAALLGLSTVTFAQGSGAGSSGPSGQDTPREASKAQAGPGSAAGGAAGSATTGSGAVVTTPAPGAVVVPGAVVSTRCDAMTGDERTRCLRDERASAGSSAAGVPATQRPGDSGPGALDKTNPGQQRGTAPSPKDAGTSSAGSTGGK